MRMRATQRHHEQLIASIEVLRVPADIADDAQTLDARRPRAEHLELSLLRAEIDWRRRRRNLRHRRTAELRRDDVSIFLVEVRPLNRLRQCSPLFRGKGGRERWVH